MTTALMRPSAFFVLAAILLLGLICGAPRSTAAQEESPIVVTAAPAYGGTFKIGNWLPVAVTLTNNGGDTRVDVRARVTGQAAGTSFVVPVDLPAGATKQVTLYTLPQTLPRRFPVEVIPAGGGDVIAASEVQVNPLFSGDTLCGVAGFGANGLPTLGRGQMAGRNSRVTSLVDLQIFPLNPAGLDTLDCLVIGGGEGLVALQSEAQAALASWVHGGGQLIVATGERWQTALGILPPELAAVEATAASTSTDLSGLAALGIPAPPQAPFVLAELQVPASDPTVRVVAESAGKPLIVGKELGTGRIQYLAFDPSAATFTSWAGMTDFWDSLILSSTSHAQWQAPEFNPRLFDISPMVNALKLFPAVALPSSNMLLVLLGIYLVLVLPVSFLLLRRYRRMAWAWATTIALALIFASSSYAVGASIRGDHVIINGVTITRTALDSTTSARTFASFNAPSSSSYEIHVGDRDTQTLVTPISGNPDPWAASAAPPSGTSLQGSQAGIRDLGVGDWAAKYFMVEHAVPAPPAVSANLRCDGTRVAGTITNNSDVTLSNTGITLGEGAQVLGDLAPGATVQVEFPLRRPPGMQEGMPISFFLSGADPNNFGPSGDEETTFRQMVYDTLFGFTMNGPTSQVGLNFVAWSEEPAIPISVLGHDANVNMRTLSVISLPFDVVADDGTVTVPGGLVAPRLVKSEADNVLLSGANVEIYNGSAEFDLLIPAEYRPTTVDALTIDLENQFMGGAPVPIVEIWDPHQVQFVEIDVSRGQIELEQPEYWLGDHGSILRLRLSSGQMGSVYCLLQVELQGSGGILDGEVLQTLQRVKAVQPW